MFKWFTKVDRELDAAVNSIDKKIDEIVTERDQALAEVERLKNKIQQIDDAVSDADMSIDFNAVNVFSVERNTKDDLPCTIVGFLIKDGETFRHLEWYLYCSERVHKNIITDFEAHKALAISK